MKRMLSISVAALLLGLSSAGLQAKLPVPQLTPEQKMQAEAAKAKAAAAAKLEADELAKAQDRAVENYRRNQGKAATGTPAPTAKRK